jgi:5-methylcytosine-specific restriction enzyme A
VPQRPKVHQAVQGKPKPEARASACKRGYGRAWQALRLSHLADHPLCVACSAKGLTTEATEVDHTTPHRGDRTLLMDPDNLTSMCKSCHSAKTVASDGGFGRPVGETDG